MNNYIELYIHIPFCEKKCNYCDFISFNANDEIKEKYIENLISEIENKHFIAKNTVISSIYIGGGTPSILEYNKIEKILETVKKNYVLIENPEITIELNPNSVDIYKLKSYYDNGINRLSFGVQTTNDNELKILGRIHTYADFLKSYDEALHVGFKNINVDLINGIPNSNSLTYKKSLKQVLSLNIKHISIYNLIIEKNTPFYKMQQEGKLQLPEEDELLKMDEITKELTDYYRLKKYEISNYSKPGYECKHNLGYWSDIPYIGFGLNASSYYHNKRFKNISSISQYLSTNFNNFEENYSYFDEILCPNKNQLMSEYFFLGMRKSSGINSKDFFYRFDEIFENTFYLPLKKYLSLGLIIKNNDNYFFSEKGMDISNKILSEFLL